MLSRILGTIIALPLAAQCGGTATGDTEPSPQVTAASPAVEAPAAGTKASTKKVDSANCGCHGDHDGPEVTAVLATADREAIEASDAPSIGDSAAPVTLVMFSDYQCPFCRKASATAQAIANKYGRDVRIVFRNRPLPFHDQAQPAAKAALAAAEQGKFAEYQRELYSHQQHLDAETLEQLAEDVGLDLTKFREAMSSTRVEERLNADLKLAERVGARGTPTWFVNGRRIMGAQPLEEFNRVIARAREAR